jgi:hypothetical protein
MFELVGLGVLGSGDSWDLWAGENAALWMALGMEGRNRCSKLNKLAIWVLELNCSE